MWVPGTNPNSLEEQPNVLNHQVVSLTSALTCFGFFLCVVLLYFALFETGSHYLALADLELGR